MPLGIRFIKIDEKFMYHFIDSNRVLTSISHSLSTVPCQAIYPLIYDRGSLVKNVSTGTLLPSNSSPTASKRIVSISALKPHFS